MFKTSQSLIVHKGNLQKSHILAVQISNMNCKVITKFAGFLLLLPTLLSLNKSDGVGAADDGYYPFAPLIARSEQNTALISGIGHKDVSRVHENGRRKIGFLSLDPSKVSAKIVKAFRRLRLKNAYFENVNLTSITRDSNVQVYVGCYLCLASA